MNNAAAAVDFIYATVTVVLPDGDVGTALLCELETERANTDVHVVHRDRLLGRGPWIFHRSQVRQATPAEAADYLARCGSR